MLEHEIHFLERSISLHRIEGSGCRLGQDQCLASRLLSRRKIREERIPTAGTERSIVGRKTGATGATSGQRVADGTEDFIQGPLD
jgi:hypothetical protein